MTKGKEKEQWTERERADQFRDKKEKLNVRLKNLGEEEKIWCKTNEGILKKDLWDEGLVEWAKKKVEWACEFLELVEEEEKFVLTASPRTFVKEVGCYAGKLREIESGKKNWKIYKDRWEDYIKKYEVEAKKSREKIEEEQKGKNFSLSESPEDSDEEIGLEKTIETVLGTIEAVCFFAGWAMGKDLTGTGPLREEVGSSGHYKQTELIISPPPSPPKDW